MRGAGELHTKSRCKESSWRTTRAKTTDLAFAAREVDDQVAVQNISCRDTDGEKRALTTTADR